MPRAISILGLETKSTAPSASARKVISEPRSVNVETITTGIGRRRIKRSRKSNPSILGISTSSVSTSGFKDLIISRATSGSGAAPTHIMSFSRSIISFITLRINAESSTTNTLIFRLSRGTSFQILSCIKDGIRTSFKQFHIACQFGKLQASLVFTLAIDNRVVVYRLQLLHANQAGLWEKIHFTWIDIEQIFSRDMYPFRFKVMQHELRIACPHIGNSKSAQYR